MRQTADKLSLLSQILNFIDWHKTVFAEQIYSNQAFAISKYPEKQIRQICKIFKIYNVKIESSPKNSLFSFRVNLKQTVTFVLATMNVECSY